MKLIDLRSDTVTKPDKNIIEEALQAKLGDDEYGEDPTVNNLQEKCAELLGFESGLFVSSGLMGNQISLLIHNSPGTEVVTTSDSHIKNYEHGAASFLSRVQFREIDHKDGALNLDSIKTFTQAGGKLSDTLIKEYCTFCDLNDKEFIVMYGQTEASPRISCINVSKNLKKKYSIGKPFKETYLKINKIMVN